MIRRLMHVALRKRTSLLLAAVSLALLALTQLYLTWIIKEWVERSLMDRGAHSLWPLALRASVAALAGMASLFVSRYALATANQQLVERLREDAMAALLRAPVAVVREHSAGQWLSRLFHDVNILSTFLSTVARRVVSETIVLAGAVTLMFVLHWRLALSVVLAVPFAAFLLIRMGRRIRRWGADAQQATAALTATAAEQLQGFTTIKGYQAEDAMLAQIRNEAARLRRRVLRGELWSAALISLVFLLAGAAFIGTVIWGTLFLEWTAAGQATFLAFCLYAGQTIEPARRLSEVHGLLQQSLAASERVFAVIDLRPENTWMDDANRAGTNAPALALDRVSFTYGDEPVLREINFALAEGEMTGLRAPSGYGKTTIARLLVRFLEPDEGSITVAGRDIRAIPLAELRRIVCVVEQDPFVFSGPLLDNLLLGKPDATREEAAAAARLCGIERELDELVTEAGRDLSGGEKQRIALARAVLRNPPLLVLDEATSSLDEASEAAIFAALTPWLRGRTVLAISHRPSTMQRFSRVVELDVLRPRAPAPDTPARLPVLAALDGEAVEAAPAESAVVPPTPTVRPRRNRQL